MFCKVNSFSGGSRIIPCYRVRNKLCAHTHACTHTALKVGVRCVRSSERQILIEFWLQEVSWGINARES